MEIVDLTELSTNDAMSEVNDQRLVRHLSNQLAGRDDRAGLWQGKSGVHVQKLAAVAEEVSCRLAGSRFENVQKLSKFEGRRGFDQQQLASAEPKGYRLVEALASGAGKLQPRSRFSDMAGEIAGMVSKFAGKINPRRSSSSTEPPFVRFSPIALDLIFLRLTNQNGIGRCRSMFRIALNFVVWLAVYRFDGHNWPKRPYHVTEEEDLAAEPVHDVILAIFVIMFCAAVLLLVVVALQLICVANYAGMTASPFVCVRHMNGPGIRRPDGACASCDCPRRRLGRLSIYVGNRICLVECAPSSSRSVSLS